MTNSDMINVLDVAETQHLAIFVLDIYWQVLWNRSVISTTTTCVLIMRRCQGDAKPDITADCDRPAIKYILLERPYAFTEAPSGR